MDAHEHYHEAERLLGQHRPAHDRAGPLGDDSIARAQVHATLALAAVTAQAKGSPLGLASREGPILDRWRPADDG
jgi:hypothetical protein